MKAEGVSFRHAVEILRSGNASSLVASDKILGVSKSNSYESPPTKRFSAPHPQTKTNPKPEILHFLQHSGNRIKRFSACLPHVAHSQPQYPAPQNRNKRTAQHLSARQKQEKGYHQA